MQVKRALMMMLVAQLLVAVGSILIKQLGTGAPVYQLLLFRQLFASALLLPILWFLPGGRKPSPYQKLHIFRSLLIAAGNVLFLLALLHLPLVTVTAVLYTAPIILVLIGHLLLPEKLDAGRLVAVCIGFAGILMIARPNDANIYVILAFVAAITVALNSVCLKRIAHKEHPLVTLFWSNVYCIVLLVPIALWEGRPISQPVVTVGLWLAVFYIAMTWLVVNALRRADASQIAPADYSGLVFAALFGYWFFEEAVGFWTLAGIVVVMLSVLIPALKHYSLRRNGSAQAGQASASND